jgi:hypothetical protein
MKYIFDNFRWKEIIPVLVLVYGILYNVLSNIAPTATDQTKMFICLVMCLVCFLLFTRNPKDLKWFYSFLLNQVSLDKKGELSQDYEAQYEGEIDGKDTGMIDERISQKHLDVKDIAIEAARNTVKEELKAFLDKKMGE